MRIISKQRAVCACVVAATLAFAMSEALAAARGGAGGPHAGAAHSGRPTPGPGVAGGAAPGWRPPHSGAWSGYPSHAARYGEFGPYAQRQQYGCGGGACGGGYWGGGGVYYGDGYYDPNFEVGIGSGGPGYYDSYAYGRPAALTALPPVAPEYGMPGQRVIEVPVTVMQTNVQTVGPSPAANPHIIELPPAK
jgi:hypothetical protein